MKKETRFITQAGLIAALYVALTYVSSIFGLSSGAVQCRLSEALCVLPAFTPAAVPGLFIGCLIANLLTGCIVIDVVLGSAATLLGAAITYIISKKLKNPVLYTLPEILVNTLIVPFVIKYAYGSPDSVWFIILTFLAGEVISAGALGTGLYYALRKKAGKIFK